MTAADVFISYSHQDRDVARRFADALQAAGLRVWWDDHLRSGEAFDEKIEAALRAAKAVVVLWSKTSVASRWVRAEATLADRSKTLVPVMIEPCERPIMFELSHTSELGHWQGDAGDAAWHAFLGDVRRMVGGTAPTQAETPAAPAKVPPGVGGLPLVGVLPLACRAGDDDLEFFTEDLTDEITVELSRDGYFKVIAGGTMAAWRGRQVDHRIVGRELGARYLIDGKVQRAGGQMRLTLQLIEVETTSMLWSEKYPCAEDNLDQREAIVGGIAAHLTELILHLEMARAVKQTGDLTAWDHILRAMNGSNRASRESIRIARNEARQAVAIAPDFGLAHANLAANLVILAWMFGGDEDIELEEIRRHIERAHELDGENPVVLRLLAGACTRMGEFTQALRFAERAVTLNRNSTHGQMSLAFACLALGRTSDAIAAFAEQEQLAPHDGLRYASLSGLGMAHYLEGRPQDALAALERSLTLHPNYVPALRLKAIVAKTLGDERVAQESLAKLREVEPGATLEWAMKGLAQAFDDKSLVAEAQAVLRALWAEAPS